MSKQNQQKSLRRLMNEKNGTDKLLICPYCTYKWNYSGSLSRATCPSCSNKVKVKENTVSK